MKAHIITFGCRSNQCDSRWLAESLIKAGCAITENPQEADVIIVNTCTVTAEGERQGRQSLRRCRRENPQTVVIATGCAVHADPASFLNMHEIDYVADLNVRGQLSEMIHGLELRNVPMLLRPPKDSGQRDKCFFVKPAEDMLTGVARVPLKIQDGCDNACTYCIVSRVRGVSWSMPPEEVNGHLEALGRAGAREVVLTGIHLGGWGRDLDPQRTLASLLRRVIARKYIERIRLSSLDPIEMTGEILDLLVEGDGLCPHVHLPLQAADDEILRAMGRRYDLKEAAVRIRLLKQAVPHAAVGLDMIVGFPGETDQHYDHALKRLHEIPFDYLHVFPYSQRPGTPAAQMDNQVDHEIVRTRASRLHKLSAIRRKAFWESSMGTIRSVVVESRAADDRWFGHTDNYIPTFIRSHKVGPGDVVSVALCELENAGVRGEIIR